MASFVVVVIVLIASILIAANNSHIMIPSYVHLFGGKVQEWTNVKDNIKIEFTYFPEKPIIDTFTTLNFSIQNYILANTLKILRQGWLLLTVRDCSNLKT
ncbi:MAG: hypothetical protein WBQ16_06950 [Nitrososphaeraceae archaeon]